MSHELPEICKNILKVYVVPLNSKWYGACKVKLLWVEQMRGLFFNYSLLFFFSFFNLSFFLQPSSAVDQHHHFTAILSKKKKKEICLLLDCDVQVQTRQLLSRCQKRVIVRPYSHVVRLTHWLVQLVSFIHPLPLLLFLFCLCLHQQIAGMKGWKQSDRQGGRKDWWSRGMKRRFGRSARKSSERLKSCWLDPRCLTVPTTTLWITMKLLRDFLFPSSLKEA